MQGGVDTVKNSVPETMSESVDRELGIFIHKYIATLFYWDDRVQAMVFGGETSRGREYIGIRPLMQQGRKEEALEVSDEMKAYIHYKVNNDRRYEKELDRISEAMTGAGDKVVSKFESLGAERFLDWLTGKDPEEFKPGQENGGGK